MGRELNSEDLERIRSELRAAIERSHDWLERAEFIALLAALGEKSRTDARFDGARFEPLRDRRMLASPNRPRRDRPDDASRN